MLRRRNMKQISMLEFRRDAEAIIRQVRRGKRFIMTYRGKPVMRLEPLEPRKIRSDDPIYRLGELAEPMGSLTNEEIDRIVYET